MPSADFPPHRYGVPVKPSATRTKSGASVSSGATWGRIHEAVAADLHERAPYPFDDNATVERHGGVRRLLHIRRGIYKSTIDDNPMRGRHRQPAERGHRDITDVSVAIGLRPAPSVIVVVDGQRLAIEHLRLERRVRTRITLQIDGLGQDGEGLAFDERVRLDLPAQERGGQIAARGGDARIERRDIARHGAAP